MRGYWIILSFIGICFSLDTIGDDTTIDKLSNCQTICCSEMALLFFDRLEYPGQVSEKLNNLMVPPVLTRTVISKSEYLQACKSAHNHDLACRSYFGIGYLQVENMMRNNNDDFVKRLLGDGEFSDDSIRVLWQEYKDRGMLKKKNKDTCERQVQAELQYRQKIRQAAQTQKQKRFELARQEEDKRIERQRQEYLLWQKEQLLRQQKEELRQAQLRAERAQEVRQSISVQDRYKLSDFDLSGGFNQVESICFDIPLQQQWLERQKAVARTVLSEYVQYDQKHELSPQTIGYLQSQGLNHQDFQYFFGTALQQQLHSESCQVLMQIAEQQRSMQHQSQMLQACLAIVDGAHETNKFEQVTLTSRLMDMSWCMLDLSKAAFPYLQAITKGAVHSATDFVHIATCPCETISALAKSVYFVLETAALNDPETEPEYAEIYSSLRDERNKQTKDALRALGRQLSDSTGPQRVEALMRFGADFIVPGKIIHAVGSALGCVRSQVKAVGSVKNVTSGVSKEQALQVLQEFEMVTQEGLTQKVAVEMMEAEKQVQKTTLLMRSVKVVIGEVRALGGVIPLHRVDLLEEVKTIISKIQARIHVPIKKDVLMKYRQRVTNKNGIRQEYNLHINHVVNFDMKLINDKQCGGYVLEIAGGHGAKSCDLLAQENIVRITNKKLLSNGCWEYKLQNNLTGKLFTKTEFPSSWTQEKIFESAWEAFDAGIDIPAKKGKSAKKITIDNVEMSIIIKQPNNIVTNIITVLPYVGDA